MPHWPKRCLTPFAKGNATLLYTLHRLRKLGDEMQVLPLKTKAKKRVSPLSFSLSIVTQSTHQDTSCIPLQLPYFQQGMLTPRNVSRAKLNVKEAKFLLPGCIFPLPISPSLALPFAWRSCAEARLLRPPWWAVRLERTSKNECCSQKDMSEGLDKKRLATIFSRQT